ncbi:MAG: redox-sensing transcriptional repressor Rex [Chloroflexi bacterium]|nr:MAG: redox-sensing transcriptional repressor Rex [Chloroflexota bacterium]HDN80043.1 redox-sensing transcriptional repressor Rex [Chloroflexota bacterium]
MAAREVPNIVISRLPLYLRALEFMQREGKQVVASRELAERLGVSSAQIRKDLSYFGEFGKQGSGYQVDHLILELKRILKVDREWDMALVGVGDLGRALVHYEGFKGKGFCISLLFDNNPEKIGAKINDLEIMDSRLISELIPKWGIKIAIIAVPPQEAQGVADELVKAGVLAILNYAPITLKVPKHVKVQYIDPVVHLQRMTYYIGGNN